MGFFCFTKPNKSMKTILLSTCLVFTLFSYAFAQKGSGKKNEFNLEDITGKINKALIDAQSNLQDVDLQEASITLENVVSVTKGGGFKIFAKASKKWTKESSSSVTYNFTPAKSLTAEKNLDNLAKSIIDAVENYKKLKDNPISKMAATSFELEIAFTIKDNGSGGVEFELWGISVDAGIEQEKSAVHKIKLKFG
jgi:hypothetical protein